MSDFPISRKYDTPLNLRHAGMKYGVRRIDGSPQLDATGEVQDGAGALQEDEGRLLANLEARSSIIEDSTPYVENADVWKIRIHRMGRTAWQRTKKLWAGRRAFLMQILDSEFPLRTRIDILRSGRQLTPQELQEVREDIESRQQEEFHQAQAEIGRRRIKNTLTRLGHCNYTEKDGHRYINSTVQIPYVEVCPLYYRYYVDPATMPFRVKVMDIQGDDVCTDLSFACEHPVRSEIRKIDNSVIGLMYTIEIAATMGVPNVCKFSELLPLVPPTAPPLAFITGYSEGKRLRFADLEDMPHFLGGGQTKGGKSNMMHVIACTLISRNTPDALHMLMIDLKFNGIEMDRYKGTPHLIAAHELSQPGDFVPEAPSGIATVPEQAVGMLRWLVHEATRRGNMFTKAGVQNLRQWNRLHPRRHLPYIVIINDELAQLRLDPEYGKESYDLLQKILSMARAAGVSFVTFTQSSSARVIDEFIKINLPGRICFSVPDAASSILFIGNGSAIGLMPAGRAMYRYGTGLYMVQTPLIELKDISEVVANARQGRLTSHLSARPVLPEEIIEWAVEHNQSSIAQRDVFRKYGSELQRIEYEGVVNLLREMEGKDYRVGDHVYQVLPGVGNRPRVLRCIDKELAEAEEAAAAAPESPIASQIAGESGRRCAYCQRTVQDVALVECEYCGAPLEG